MKYEIHSIKNSQGKGGEQNFVRIFTSEAMDEERLEQVIQDSCSLTMGDVKATLSALRELMIYQLVNGSRVTIPGIGHFSLSVRLQVPPGCPVEKVTAANIIVRNIDFRPDARLLAKVRQGARFERSTKSSKSTVYSPERLQSLLERYLATNVYITRRIMEYQFGLRSGTALRWLRHFVSTGFLRREGSRNSPVYLLCDAKKRNVSDATIGPSEPNLATKP